MCIWFSSGDIPAHWPHATVPAYDEQARQLLHFARTQGYKPDELIQIIQTIFNVFPRPRQPRRSSGQAFVARNPDVSPYEPFWFSPHAGALLLPHVSAPDLHDLFDAVEADVLAKDAELPRVRAAPRVPTLASRGAGMVAETRRGLSDPCRQAQSAR